MKKKLFLLPLVAVATMAMTSCSGGDKKPTSTDHTVTWDLNYSGAPAATTSTVKDGVPVTKPETDPTRDSFLFDNWHTAPTGSAKYDFSTPVKSDLTLYAHWKEAWNVTFKYNYDGAGDYLKVAVAKDSGELDEPKEPERDGYIFTKWTVGPESTSEEFDFLTEVDKDLTLYAQWEDDPNKEFPTETFEDFLGLFAEEPFNVVIPEWKATNYVTKRYLDCLQVVSKKPAFDTTDHYSEILVKSGDWTLDEAAQVPTANHKSGKITMTYGFTSDGFTVLIAFNGNEANFERATNQTVYAFPEPSADIFKKLELFAVPYNDGSVRTYAATVELADAYKDNLEGAIDAWITAIAATGDYNIADDSGYTRVIHKNCTWGGWIGITDGELEVQLMDIYGWNNYGTLDEESYLYLLKLVQMLPEEAENSTIPTVVGLDTDTLIALNYDDEDDAITFGFMDLPAVPSGETKGKTEYWSLKFAEGLIEKGWLLDSENFYVNTANQLTLTLELGEDTTEGSAFFFTIEHALDEFPASVVAKFILSEAELPSLTGASVYTGSINEEKGTLTINCYVTNPETVATNYIQTLTTAGYTLDKTTNAYVSSDGSVSVLVDTNSSAVVLTVSNIASKEFPTTRIANFIDRQVKGDKTVVPEFSGHTYLSSETDGVLTVNVLDVTKDTEVTDYENALVTAEWTKIQDGLYVSKSLQIYLNISYSAEDKCVTLNVCATSRSTKLPDFDKLAETVKARTDIDLVNVTPTVEFDILQANTTSFTDADGTNIVSATVYTTLLVSADGQSLIEENVDALNAYGAALAQEYINNGYTLRTAEANTWAFFTVYKIVDGIVYQVNYQAYKITTEGAANYQLYQGQDGGIYWYYKISALSYPSA